MNYLDKVVTSLEEWLWISKQDSKQVLTNLWVICDQAGIILSPQTSFQVTRRQVSISDLNTKVLVHVIWTSTTIENITKKQAA